MKKIPAIFLCMFLAIASCKKKDSSLPPAGSSPLNGLTGITYKMSNFSGGVYTGKSNIKWVFSGTNPIIARPDSAKFGTVTMYLTGKNATKLVYKYFSGRPDDSAVATIKYNASNMPDTVFIDLSYTSLSPLTPTHRALVFYYTDAKITKITSVGSADYMFRDTLQWAHPVYNYYYSYNGPDVTRVATESRPNTTDSYTTYTDFTTGSLKNNLAKAFPQYFLVEFGALMNGLTYDMTSRLPFYLCENVIVSALNYTPGAFSYLTDGKGRITHMVTPNNYTFDTTFYYY